ncbi:MAG: chemotaxis response regulator protein-glutamate methylesterase, partial [Alphaproteobacteria bacterium]
KFSNGKQAVDGVAACAPDILILDIEMPVMDGMTALPQILRNCAGVKVIMASTLTRRNAEISLKALSLGAVDYIPKPEGNSGVTRSATFREELINKIKAVGESARRRRAASVPPPAAHAAPAPAPAHAPVAEIQLRPFSQVTPRILAIGSSTGGPKALSQVIHDVAGFIPNVPVVITQHMPPTFTSILAEHLGRDGNCDAKEAENGEPLLPGRIYVAPGGFHMALARNGDLNTIRIYDGPEVNFCKPAVDPLFMSVAEIYGPAALGVVLTGMGHDGAQGARRIADTGGSIIAQDEATSVVWGMPGATAAAGACAAVLPLDKIGPKVAELLKGDHA